nr:immunoglobulin heavy chain junction region [Macaca mulatta]
LARKEDDLDLW